MTKLIGSTIFVVSPFLSGHAIAASCFSGSQAIAPSKIAADKASIQANAAKWLTSNGGGLASAVRDLAGSDPDFAATIVLQAKGASPEQAAAVGAGLGQAAGACSRQPEDAAKIQAAVAASTDQSLVASYASTGGNTQTAATGGGGGGAGGGGGGAGAGGGGGTGGQTSPTNQAPTGAVPAASATGTTNTFSNLLTGGSAGAGSITTTTTAAVTTASTTVGTSVSAH